MELKLRQIFWDADQLCQSFDAHLPQMTRLPSASQQRRYRSRISVSEVMSYHHCLSRFRASHLQEVLYPASAAPLDTSFSAFGQRHSLLGIDVLGADSD